jgi:hypothetical protein
MSFQKKYLKYKAKYLALKNGGGGDRVVIEKYQKEFEKLIIEKNCPGIISFIDSIDKTYYDDMPHIINKPRLLNLVNYAFINNNECSVLEHINKLSLRKLSYQDFWNSLISSILYLKEEDKLSMKLLELLLNNNIDINYKIGKKQNFLDYLLFMHFQHNDGPSNIVEIISFLESKGATRNFTKEEYERLKV